jgi:hypothetical protein
MFPATGYVQGPDLLHWINKLYWMIICNECCTCTTRRLVYFFGTVHVDISNFILSLCRCKTVIMVRGERWSVEGYWEEVFCKERSGSNILLGETTKFVGSISWRDLMSITLDDTISSLLRFSASNEDQTTYCLMMTLKLLERRCKLREVRAERRATISNVGGGGGGYSVAMISCCWTLAGN